MERSELETIKMELSNAATALRRVNHYSQASNVENAAKKLEELYEDYIDCSSTLSWANDICY